uniref:t-SNARE coiled-coil homology domain-containing protein n=1 Tax=Mastacembelus armatus TaxID=205130 RepID=A0A3Q3LF33_9TELE
MSYGSIDGGSFGSRNPFGGPTRQGYQPVVPNCILLMAALFNCSVVTLEKKLQSLGTSRDTAELRQSLPQTPSSEQVDDGPLFREGAGSKGGAQAFLSEISEEDVEVLRQREEALLQIERDMLDVSQIMKDLASMVHEQGDTIGKIKYTVYSLCVSVCVYIVVLNSISKDNLCVHV